MLEVLMEKLMSQEAMNEYYAEENKKFAAEIEMLKKQLKEVEA